MPKILVVEDHPDTRKFMVALLERMGFEVVAGATVAEGIAKLDGQSIALLDLHLPDGSGTDVLKHIRQQSHYTRVAYITADYDISELMTKSELAADAVFRKPIEFDTLLDWINQTA